MRIKNGFSLIEILVTIAIIAIMAAVGLVMFSSTQAKGRDSRRVQDLQQIQVTIEQYYQDNNYYPTDLSVLVPKYISRLPVDPKNTGNFRYTYTPNCGIGGKCTSYALTANSETSNNFRGTDDSAVAMVSLPAGTTPSPEPSSSGAATPMPTPTPAAATRVVKILVLRYFPLDASGTKLDPTITGMNSDLSVMRTNLTDLTQSGMTNLSNGSKYHGYTDSSITPSFIFSKVDDKEFLKAMPISTNRIPWNLSVFRPDYKKMLTEDVGICSYVDDGGVSQVWIYGYHYGLVEPAEGNMSMGRNSSAFWNHGTFGDVSNSEQIDDMPLCNKTYILLNYNYSRGLGELIEDHTHHIERIMGFADTSLWDSFVNPHGQGGGVTNHCGWTHSPPNVTDALQYHWREETVVKSDCQDWRPGGGGVIRDTSCHTWYGAGACLDDMGVLFKVWWMQSIPGLGNTLTSGGAALRNWWDFYVDFDDALTRGKKLTN